jgi:hypothetical protein
MGRVHRLHDSFTLVIGALAAVAIIDGDLAFKNIAKHRDAVLMQNGAPARRQRDDGGGHMRRTVRRVMQRLAQDGGAGRQKRCRGRNRRGIFLRAEAAGRRESDSEQSGDDDGNPITHGLLLHGRCICIRQVGSVERTRNPSFEKKTASARARPVVRTLAAIRHVGEKAHSTVVSFASALTSARRLARVITNAPKKTLPIDHTPSISVASAFNSPA